MQFFLKVNRVQTQTSRFLFGEEQMTSIKLQATCRAWRELGLNNTALSHAVSSNFTVL